MSAGFRAVLIIVLSCWLAAARAEEAVRVFAAASLTDALTAIAARWQASGHPGPSLAFAGSSTLARQIEAGAPAELFASADRRWMDELQQHGLIEPGTRIDLLSNELVLVVPRGRRFAVDLRPDFAFDAAFSGRLCTGEPGVVPVGTYAREALQSLGWWDRIRGRIVGTDDVRAALAFVERGECAAGIVYATDAVISRRVEVLARFPASTHAPIVYPFALVKGAGPEARRFLDYLRDDPAAAAEFRRFGFQPATGQR